MNIPNKITVSRILLIPFFVIVMMFDFGWGNMALFGAEMPVNHFVGRSFLFSLQHRLGRWLLCTKI